MHLNLLGLCLALAWFPTKSSQVGVCTRTVSYVETYLPSSADVVSMTYWDCSGWRCSKRKFEYPSLQIKTRLRWRDENFCCSGYKSVGYSGTNCAPICSPECINGTCTSPGECSCIANHKMKNDHICVPICQQECGNGTCVGFNLCSCFKGYVVPPNGKSCEPVCSFSCANGKCVRPDECECNKGYEWHPSIKRCMPICHLECINGNCTGVNECTCRQNYSKSDKNWNVCEPICTPSCINSICVDYNNCSCLDSYEKDETNSNQCNPICMDECVNANCTQPDVCICNEGYRYSFNSSNVCEPVCEDCQNGECTAPEVCECNEGYIRESDMCQPDCGGCVNSICVSPNSCECFPGFIKRNETFCADVCNDGNSTEDCVHVVESLLEHPLRRHDLQAISLPKNGVALSVDYSCRDFLDLCDTERCLSNATFECMAEKNEETVDLKCQRGTSDLEKSPEPHFNHTYNETSPVMVNVNLTFIFPKGKSKGNCRLCFSEDFNVVLDRPEATIITILPCKEVSQVLESKSHTSVVAMTMTSFGVFVLLAVTIVVVYIKKRSYSGSINIATEEHLVADDEL